MFGCRQSFHSSIYFFSKASVAIFCLWLFVFTFDRVSEVTNLKACQECFNRAKIDYSASLYAFTSCSCFLQQYTNPSSLTLPDQCLNTRFLADCTIQSGMETCDVAQSLPNMQVKGFFIHEEGKLDFFKMSLLGSIFIFFLFCCAGIAFYGCADQLHDQVAFTSATLSLFCSQFLFIIVCCMYSNIQKNECLYVDIPLTFLVIISSISFFNLLLILITFIFILLPNFSDFKKSIIRSIITACFIQSMESVLVIVYSSDVWLQCFSFLIVFDWILLACYILLKQVAFTFEPVKEAPDYSLPDADLEEDHIKKSIIVSATFQDAMKMVSSYEPISADELSEEESSSLSDSPAHPVFAGQLQDIDPPQMLKEEAHPRKEEDNLSSLGTGTIIGQRPDTTKTVDTTFAIGMVQPLPPRKQDSDNVLENVDVDEEEDFSEQLSNSYPSVKPPRFTPFSRSEFSSSYPGLSHSHLFTDTPSLGKMDSGSSSIDSDEFQEEYLHKQSVSMPKPPIRRQHKSFSAHSNYLDVSSPVNQHSVRKWSDSVVTRGRILQWGFESPRMSSEDFSSSEQLSLPQRFDRLVSKRREMSAERSRRRTASRKGSKDPTRWTMVNVRKVTDPLKRSKRNSRGAIVRKGTDPELYHRHPRMTVIRREERSKLKKRKRNTKQRRMMKMKPSERRRYRNSDTTNDQKISMPTIPSEMIHKHVGDLSTIGVMEQSDEIKNRENRGRSVWSDTTEAHIPKADFGRKPIVGRAKVLRLHE